MFDIAMRLQKDPQVGEISTISPSVFYDQGSDLTDLMPFDELPHVLRGGLDAVFRQFLSNRPCAFPFSPQG